MRISAASISRDRVFEAGTSCEREISAVGREFERGNPAGIHGRISSARGGDGDDDKVVVVPMMVVVMVAVMMVVVVDGFAAKSVRNDGN